MRCKTQHCTCVTRNVMVFPLFRHRVHAINVSAQCECASKKKVWITVDSFKSGAISVGKYFRTFYRWVLLSVVTGLVCGLVGSAFHLTVDFATSFRAQHQWLVFLLPIGGLAIALIYRVSKMEGEGTNNIIDSIHDGENVPIMLVPVIFVSTAITHLVGGSAGREGAALQMGCLLYTSPSPRDRG